MSVVADLRDNTAALLFSKALRYGTKGKRFLDYPAKYHAVDTGLRNTRLNFRKIVIDGLPMSAKHINNDEIGHISLIDFLLDPHFLEAL